MNDIELGKADWIWMEGLNIHMPVCNFVNKSLGGYGTGKCGKGPLTGAEITKGRCKDHE